MSPVKQTPGRSPRAVILAVGGVALGLVLILVLFIVAIPKLTESGTVKVKMGVDTYDAGPAKDRARNIADSGPLLFPDVSSGQRDIYLQHLGTDPTTGWLAFDARLPGQPRNCTLQWKADQQHFQDPCNGTVVPADGQGLVAYTVTVDKGGDVIIDLRGDGGTTTTTAAPAATSSP